MIGIYVILYVILGIAMWYDLQYYKVPNYLIVIGLMTGFIYQFQVAGIQGIGKYILGVSFPIILLFLLFLLKAIGAGDIKLFSVIGGFWGIAFVFKIIMVALFIGAGISIFHMIRHQNLISRLQYLAQYYSELKTEREWKPYYEAKRDGRKCVIHFTIPIALSVIVCVLAEKMGML